MTSYSSASASRAAAGGRACPPSHTNFADTTWTRLRDVAGSLARPAAILRAYRRADLRPDLVAGLTVAVIMLPQAIAFAQIAELPPQMGLYAAVVGSIVGGLWGSSHHLQTGPTNTTSLLVLSVLLATAAPGTPDYLVAAGMMALLVGIFRLAMGFARLGVLVNFVSDSVIVGFTAGAGALIAINQLRHLLRLAVPSAPDLASTIRDVIGHLPTTHLISLALGLGTLLIIVALRRVNRRLPGSLIAMTAASMLVGVLDLHLQGVQVVGALPRGLPPLARLPFLDLTLIGRLSTGALAVAALGLVEAMSIGRSIAAQSGQRLDSNQEFVGQGLANIACSVFSGYTCAGSFTRTAVNYEVGARTGLAGAFAGAFVLVAMLAFAPLAAYVPLSALAGVLVVTAFGLVDRKEMVRIWHGARGDRLIMLTTLLATLLLPLQFAVLTGILMSLGHYLLLTSMPRVRPVVPNGTFEHFVHQPEGLACPQLGIVEILGDLYFGAVHHVEECIQENLARHPGQRFLLLRMHSVDNLDISGIHALEGILRTYRELGGDLYLTRVREPILAVMQDTGFYTRLGADHLLGDDVAIHHLYHKTLDPAICIYECPLRIFKECQNLPKGVHVHDLHVSFPAGLTAQDTPLVTARELWQALHDPLPPVVLDVREPREFKQGHIPQAQLVPLPALLAGGRELAESIVPRARQVVLVCRGGRRSGWAVAMLRGQGFDNVVALQGGTLAWENAGLLEAVES